MKIRILLYLFNWTLATFFFNFQTNIAQTFLLRTCQIEKIFSIFKIHTETISNFIFQSGEWGPNKTKYNYYSIKKSFCDVKST